MSTYEQVVMNLMNLEFLLLNTRELISEKEINHIEEAIAQLTVLVYLLEEGPTGTTTRLN